MSAAGAVMFARYAYPPNELGYCGPAGAGAMLDKAATLEIERRARQFEGAWSYLELLARAAGTDDPLAAEVVEGYWVGNALVDAVDPADLVAFLEQRFLGQIGGTWRDASHRARAHHSFQVFEVYPWVGILTAGRPPGPAVTVLDKCRIRTGVVVGDSDGETVDVQSRPLSWSDGQLTEAPPAVERARWSTGGRSLIDCPAVGDLVALHWDWVCEVLTADQSDRIRSAENAQLDALGLHD
ncbi:MAG: hypothetical protein H0V42_07470 [Nocardioidaceae bacterium]|nr:hypothetical protein [Nocardioidaceae bacterium]